MKPLTILFATFVAGCGTPPAPPVEDAGCPNDLPSSCPSPAPTWAQVQPVFAERCVRCHGPGGVEAQLPLDSYENVYAQRRAALNQLFACKMPPPGEPAPTAEQRALLLGWFVCGAPQ